MIILKLIVVYQAQLALMMKVADVTMSKTENVADESPAGIPAA